MERPFSLYIRPQFVATDPGFDGLLMVVPTDMRLEFKNLYAGKATDFADPTAADPVRARSGPSRGSGDGW